MENMLDKACYLALMAAGILVLVTVVSGSMVCTQITTHATI